MSVQSIYRWTGELLEPLDYCDMTETVIEAADSWLVTGGTVLALEAHRTRWLTSIPRGRYSQLDPQAFWDAALALIPTEGDWFPRVELQSRSSAPLLVFRLRSAPDRMRSVTLATWTGDDPRTQPTVKGPDLERLTAVRNSVQAVGAGEAVLLSPDGYVIEGATSALLWWRGEILCGPPAEFPRVDSVTARGVLTLATALGIDTHEEAVTPAELDGTELWALNALHGIRIVTRWVDGPQLAEQPGRLAAWRKRMDALRRPIP
jgi:branched-subunit amino acid aminotransferase/4-amino-4-deoxychorismate lyase